MLSWNRAVAGRGAIDSVSAPCRVGTGEVRHCAPGTPCDRCAHRMPMREPSWRRSRPNGVSCACVAALPASIEVASPGHAHGRAGTCPHGRRMLQRAFWTLPTSRRHPAECLPVGVALSQDSGEMPDAGDPAERFESRAHCAVDRGRAVHWRLGESKRHEGGFHARRVERVANVNESDAGAASISRDVRERVCVNATVTRGFTVRPESAVCAMHARAQAASNQTLAP